MAHGAITAIRYSSVGHAEVLEKLRDSQFASASSVFQAMSPELVFRE